MAKCPNCGEENADRAKFCWNCGQALTPSAVPTGEVRKTVTILFADIVSSTSRGEQTDPESTRRMLARYFDAMRQVVEGHGRLRDTDPPRGRRPASSASRSRSAWRRGSAQRGDGGNGLGTDRPPNRGQHRRGGDRRQGVTPNTRHR